MTEHRLELIERQDRREDRREDRRDGLRAERAKPIIKSFACSAAAQRYKKCGQAAVARRKMPHSESDLAEMPFDPNDVAYIPTTGVRKSFQTPLVQATNDNINGFGCIIDKPGSGMIEIIRWPAQGWRSVDANSGDQGGVTEGVFELWWKGETLYARNNAVGDNYVFAWSTWPGEASARDKALVWRANYHPDGGQMFFPLGGQGFVVPLALPGDDVTPEKFVAFRCDGGKGLYIHLNIWHGPVIPLDDHARLDDRQGRAHARVSVDFAKEFGGYLSVPMR